MNLKLLAKDTAIYGLSSIVGRFLNYLLVPLYTYKIAAESGGYGIVTNLYAYTALLLTLLTFGMETTMFRFSNKDGEDSRKVYGTILWFVIGIGVAFLLLVFAFLSPLSAAMGYSTHPEYIGCMAIIVAMDALQAMMFSHLRLEHRPVKFMTLKFAFIIPSILLNLFIFLVMPSMFGRFPALEQLYVRFDYGVGLIFFVNLICTTLVFTGFVSELKGLRCAPDRKLLKRFLGYSWPIVILSLVGNLNQVADKILYPHLMPGHDGMVQLGIYGACVKIAMIMSLLTQAFRYAYEPIVFNGSRDRNNPSTLADGMKYFIVFTLAAFLAVVVYMPVIRHIIQPGYWPALGTVPIVMAAEIFMGIYFNLSFWYKLTDQTWWGAVISLCGAVVMIAVNVLLVPVIGYWACAWGGFAGYGTAMLTSYLLGCRKYPIPYDLGCIGKFALTAVVLYACHIGLTRCGLPVWAQVLAGTVLLGLYLLMVYKSLISVRLKKTV